MMAKKIFDCVATVGKYTDTQGNEKKRYQNVGAIFQDDEGRMSQKLECIPVGPNWSGWISFFPPKERDASPVTEHSAAKANAYQKQPIDVDDDISF